MGIWCCKYYYSFFIILAKLRKFGLGQIQKYLYSEMEGVSELSHVRISIEKRQWDPTNTWIL